MGRFCCVFGCSSRSDRDNYISFYKIPTVIKHQGVLTEEISQTRHDRWIANPSESCQTERFRFFSLPARVLVGFHLVAESGLP